MSDAENRTVRPRSWPTDPRTANAFRTHLEWQATDGRSGRELVGDSEIDFRGADLEGLDLAWLHLWGVNFAGVRMVGVDLSKAQLVGAILDGADLSGARLVKAEANSCLARGTVFADADMLGIRMNNADLRDANLHHARLNGAHMSRSDLRRADLQSAVFGPPGPGGRTVLTEARMDGCRVEGASGSVRGPVDVQDPGNGERVLIGGARLAAWFTERGAPDVHVEE